MFMVSMWNDILMDLDAYSETLNLGSYLPEQLQELFI
jgi:hypothetical protein